MGSVEPIYARFGRELRRVRRKRGMTQEALADRVGIGRTSIVNIEGGRQRIHLHTMIDLAGALGVDPAELLPDTPESVPEIAGRVETLPAPERDWLMRVVSEEKRKESGRTHDTKT
jgi:transcriptional regulator with XRE-family HTH domain